MYQSDDHRQFARKLRKEQTEAEQALWSHLRRRQLLGFRFRRQFGIGEYTVDFECFEAKLIIELDGGQHNTETARKYDQQRTTFLNSVGYKVVRYWNHDVTEDTDAVLEAIAIHLKRLDASSPHPSPPPQGEGV